MSGRVLKEDLFGIFYVWKTGDGEWDSYYKTIDALRPLFMEIEFRKTVPGFYLNCIPQKGQKTLRISYFTAKRTADKVGSIFRDFFRVNGLNEIDFSPPQEDVVAAQYGGADYEIRFRNFLNTETQIGLDLLEDNVLHSRILFATYRLQVRRASLSFEEHFEKTFLKHSSTYRLWSIEDRAQFFTDLKEWPNPPQVDWAHMMVNFVLGADWIVSAGESKSISEINSMLSRSGMGFQIPLDWKPNAP